MEKNEFLIFFNFFLDFCCLSCLGNIELIGKCLNDCWANKKRMAHGCEPYVCKQIITKIKPHVLGKFTSVLFCVFI